MSSSSTMTSDGPVCSDFSRCVGRAAQLAHCNTLASNTMRLHVSIGPSMSRVMIAEAVPRTALLPKLPQRRKVFGREELKLPICCPRRRLASLPDRSQSGLLHRSASFLARHRQRDAVRRHSLCAEQVINVHGPHAAGNSHASRRSKGRSPHLTTIRPNGPRRARRESRRHTRVHRFT